MSGPEPKQSSRRGWTFVQELVGIVCRFGGPAFVVRHTVGRRRVGILVYHDPSPARFEAHLRHLASRYALIGLEELAAARAANEWSQIPKRALVLTFDDGHRRNFELLTLFRRYGVKPTIYLCSGIVLGDGRFWFNEPGIDPEPLKLMSPGERAAALATAAAGTAAAGERHALTIEEVRQMASGVDFGSHTVSHPVLPLCSDVEAEDEILASRSQVSSITGHSCAHFSFPNGDYTGRELELVKRSGYATARTTEIG